MNIDERIEKLRQKMAEQDIDAYVIPSGDPHQSEYVSEQWKIRDYFSNFTGSAGTLIITQEDAGLWTDSRYFTQAEHELKDNCVVMHKLRQNRSPIHLQWLKDKLGKGQRIALSPGQHTLAGANHYQNYFAKAGIHVLTSFDPIDAIWSDRPAAPKEPIYALDLKYSGQKRSEKLALLQDTIEANGGDYYLLSALDDIAWLTNLRGSDVECNPVFYSYFLAGKDSHVLFANADCIPEDIKADLKADHIDVIDYNITLDFFAQLKGTVLCNMAQVNLPLANAMEHCSLQACTNPVPLAKGIKNASERKNVETAMQKDAVALCRLYMWLEETLKTKTVTEIEVANKLHGFRKEQEHFVGDSFGAIVGYKGNGALPHYRALPESCATLEAEGVLLIDSGGQYLDGTTDTTRTVALGSVPKEAITNATLVLKGMIALGHAKFPQGTTGVQLDILARQFLWQQGLNYGHGTGHGVGAFMNVHEGPQGITTAPAGRGAQVFFEGMITSNEPAYYEEGQYGIRIENLILCEAAKEEGYLQFKDLTLFPFDRAMIEEALLTESEKAWINKYHNKVYADVEDRLTDAERGWMREKCFNF